jgi:L-rhamnose mutarotase
MQRVAFLMRIRPGTEEEYHRRHAEVWPSMLAELKAAGCRNYSIFRTGLQLFAYLEVVDLDHYRAYLAHSPVAAQWETFMSDILIREVDPVTDFPPLLSEEFHID